jgi:hypothetical protein
LISDGKSPGFIKNRDGFYDLEFYKNPARKLAEQIQTICPGIKHLYMSGYTANVITHQEILDENVFFSRNLFPKPNCQPKCEPL